jgi:hypothetical protein
MNIHHNTESNEHGTPAYIVDPVRELLGGITLDPASSATFNKVVKARRFYSLTDIEGLSDSGYNKPWRGRVFTNPPGGLCEFESGRAMLQATSKRKGCKETGACGLLPGHEHTGITSSQKAWWYKMAHNWALGFMKSGFFVGFSLELLQSAQIEYPDEVSAPHLPHHFPMCFPKTRIPFLCENEQGELEPGNQPTHANVLVYLPQFWNRAERHAFFRLFKDIGECIWPDRKVYREASR